MKSSTDITAYKYLEYILDKKDQKKVVSNSMYVADKYLMVNGGLLVLHDPSISGWWKLLDTVLLYFYCAKKELLLVKYKENTAQSQFKYSLSLLLKNTNRFYLRVILHHISQDL